MATTIAVPSKVVYTEEDSAKGTITIEGCHPGYGSTLGNALRRVLLSSLEGSAITSVRIKGVQHEFSTLPGVMEDVVQIILNLKRVRFQLHTDEPVKMALKVKGDKQVTAGDFKNSSDIEVVNGDQLIATLTEKKSELDLEVEVQKGLGYVPVDQQEREEKELGVIAIDAIYTPVRRVNFAVTNMRVGKRTDYDKVTLDVETDGSLTPKAAFDESVHILRRQFDSLVGEKQEESTEEEEK